MNPSIDLDTGWAAVRAVVSPTPLVRAHDLDAQAGGPVWLKLESLQETGSFKVRGAAAHLAGLEPSERERGVVTCSSGNHGRAVAFVAERMGVPSTVCVPKWVDPVKLEAIRSHGATALLAGDSYDDAEREALALAEREGRVYVPPFDHERIVAGQATVALEVFDVLPDVGELVIPLSGGGLLGGMALAARERGSDAVITAVSARGARVMWESLQAGHPIEVAEEPTLATALSGGIGLANRLTFDLVGSLTDRHALVDEPAIADAIRHAYGRGLVVEGGGAVALAEVLGRQATSAAAPRPVVVVVSGGNLDPSVLRSVLSEGGESDG